MPVYSYVKNTWSEISKPMVSSKRMTCSIYRASGRRSVCVYNMDPRDAPAVARFEVLGHKFNVDSQTSVMFLFDCVQACT